MDTYMGFYVAFGMLLLLSHNSSSVSQERSVTEEKELTHLALVQCQSGDNVVNCAGSIPSVSTVLTYCDCGEGDNPMVYAGVRAISEIDEEKVGKQVRNVARVVADSKDQKLKIFHVKENWNMTESVDSIDLNIKGKSEKSAKGTSCKLVGFGDGRKGHVLSQVVEDCTKCNIVDEKVFCTTATQETLLKPVDLGGPVLCGTDNLQWGINAAGVTYEAERSTTTYCNKLVNIAEHSKWINDTMVELEDEEEEGAPGGPDKPAKPAAGSGYSFHSYQNKYSNWKVHCLFLVVWSSVSLF